MSLMKLKLNKWVSLGLLVVFTVTLYLFNDKAVVPFILEVANSALYLKETQDDDPLGDVRNARTAAAQLRCENHLREDRDAAAVQVAPDSGYQAWSIGDFTYVVKAGVELPGEDGAPARYRYACKIHWNAREMNDPDNWSVYGMDVNRE